MRSSPAASLLSLRCPALLAFCCFWADLSRFISNSLLFRQSGVTWSPHFLSPTVCWVYTKDFIRMIFC